MLYVDNFPLARKKLDEISSKSAFQKFSEVGADCISLSTFLLISGHPLSQLAFTGIFAAIGRIQFFAASGERAATEVATEGADSEAGSADPALRAAHTGRPANSS